MFFAGNLFTWCCDAMKATEFASCLRHSPRIFFVRFVDFALTITFTFINILSAFLLCVTERALPFYVFADGNMRLPRAAKIRPLLREATCLMHVPSGRQTLPSRGQVLTLQCQILLSLKHFFRMAFHAIKISAKIKWIVDCDLVYH